MRILISMIKNSTELDFYEKRFFIIIFAGVIALSITACGTNGDNKAYSIENGQITESVVTDEVAQNDEIELNADNWEDYNNAPN